ncbi:MAG: PspA/IM30 family protein [Candidatus Kapabacteria bacterium]|nr:PspA/IM30 family protein [Candidatus Kapabacteria bacterium]
MFRSLFSLLQTSRSLPNASSQEAPAGAVRSSSADSNDAQRVIDESLQEMERVIARLDTAKANAQAERDESVAMLRSYQTSYNNLRDRAKSLVQAGQQAAARELLAEQHGLETVIASFERITGNMTQTVQKLSAQIDSMRIQREELKAQRTVLAAQLASATSQEEFLEKLRASGASHEFLEREAIHAELRTSVASDAHDFVGMASDSALAELEDQIQREMAHERAEQERVQNEASLKRFHVAFTNAEKAIAGTAAKANSLPHPANGADNSEAAHKQRVINDFFAPTASAIPSADAPRDAKIKANTTTESANTTEERIKNFFYPNP